MMSAPGNGNALVDLLRRPIGHSKTSFGSILLTALILFFLDLMTHRSLLRAVRFSGVILVVAICFYWLVGWLSAFWEAEKRRGQ